MNLLLRLENLPPFLSLLANPEATMQFPDKELLCRDCGTTFLFTAGEVWKICRSVARSAAENAGKRPVRVGRRKLRVPFEGQVGLFAPH